MTTLRDFIINCVLDEDFELLLGVYELHTMHRKSDDEPVLVASGSIVLQKIMNQADIYHNYYSREWSRGYYKYEWLDLPFFESSPLMLELPWV